VGFSLHWFPDGVRCDLCDPATSQDLIDSQRAVTADPRFDDLRVEITNFLGTSGVTCSPADMKLLAALDRAAALSNPNVKVAFVVDDPSTVVALGQYCERMMPGSWDTRVFNSLTAASEWLGLNVDKLCKLVV
jgi:hypothetical protein